MSKKGITIYWVGVALLALLLAAVVYALKSRPRTVPLAECSEVYRRYADTPGINAAYIKDYRVNDTVTVCVTMLEATDSAGWNLLRKDFDVVKPANTSNIELGDNCLALIPNHKTAVDLDTTDIVTASYRDKNVLVFHTKNFKDRDMIVYAIFSYNIKSLTQKKT